eukprot:794412-Pelagomonas_calceolata.AAC.5
MEDAIHPYPHPNQAATLQSNKVSPHANGKHDTSKQLGDVEVRLYVLIDQRIIVLAVLLDQCVVRLVVPVEQTGVRLGVLVEYRDVRCGVQEEGHGVQASSMGRPW